MAIAPVLVEEDQQDCRKLDHSTPLLPSPRRRKKKLPCLALFPKAPSMDKIPSEENEEESTELNSISLADRTKEHYHANEATTLKRWYPALFLVLLFFAYSVCLQQRSSDGKEKGSYTYSDGEQAPKNAINQTTRVVQDATKEVIYSRARFDRSGASIQDMLSAHSYAFEMNATYGGLCGIPKHANNIKRLIRSIGLQDELKFACPAGVNASGAVDEFNSPRGPYVRFPKSDEWIQYIQSKISFPEEEDEESVFHIAVHIRRGDIDICAKDWTLAYRYLPNEYFLNLIEENLPKQSNLRSRRVQVDIYSESGSTESFDEFQSKGFNLHLDTDIADVWKNIMQADLAILSESAFSWVPGILNRRGAVISTPTNLPVTGWKVVPDEVMHEAKRTKKKLRQTLCETPELWKP